MTFGLAFLVTLGVACAVQGQEVGRQQVGRQEAGQEIRQGPGQDHDPIVTSDSPEYCESLVDRIIEMGRDNESPSSAEASTLSAEGERMCVHGQTHGGIMRLRRAITIMRHVNN